MTLADWRGTPIHPGHTVIYGAGVGRSIELVEATVLPHPDNPYEPHLTASGDVWVRVIRRSYQTPATDRTRVGADRLTVVTALPLTSLPTAREKIIDKVRSDIAYEHKAIAKANAIADWPTHNERGEPNWTRDKCVTYHHKCIRDAERKLTRLDKDPT